MYTYSYPNEFLIVVGKKIADARHMRGEKCVTVAKAIGLSHTVISQIENGRYNCVKYTTLLALFRYLEIPMTSPILI